MHPELLKLTVQSCRDYIEAGDCHGEAPHIERLIEAVVQLADSKPLAASVQGMEAQSTDVDHLRALLEKAAQQIQFHNDDYHHRTPAAFVAELLDASAGVTKQTIPQSAAAPAPQGMEAQRDRTLIRTTWEFAGASRWIDEDTITAILAAAAAPAQSTPTRADA